MATLVQRWEQMFAALVAFRAAFGHVRVPRLFVTGEGERLGDWVHRQRSLATVGTLPAERRHLLDSVGFAWSLAHRDAALAAFAAFHSTHGHGLVPHTFRTADGLPLGTWVQSRRRQWSRNPADAERLWPELVAMGFVWEVRDNDAGWAAGVAALEQYQRDHGDALVPYWFVTAAGFPLGRWVDSRRVEYRNDTLAPARVQPLEELGMVWRLRLPPEDPARRRREDTQFERMAERVQSWSAGHDQQLPAARTVDADGVGIGRWLLRQRRLHRRGELSPDRTIRLDTALAAWRAPEP